jgi:hypothetical protein
MKKRTLLFLAVVVLAGIAASCTHHTCPAYRGSTVMVESGIVNEV